MKCCMLAYTHYERDNRVRRYAETLARRGDQVDVISLKRPGQADFDPVKTLINNISYPQDVKLLS